MAAEILNGELHETPRPVCEVISPSNTAVTRGEKMRICRREGVGHPWLLNPVVRMLEIYRVDGGRCVFVDAYANEDVVRAEPFDAIELSLSLLWER
jgi:Uma2 family endonuclease